MSLYDDVEREARHDWLNERVREPVDAAEDEQPCLCDADCDYPCWQRDGIAPPCDVCGCGGDA
jgi:hypothetical protein